MHHPNLQTYHLWCTFSILSVPRCWWGHPQKITRTCKYRICIFRCTARHNTRCGRPRHVCSFVSNFCSSTSTVRVLCLVAIYSTFCIIHTPYARRASSARHASRSICIPWPSSHSYSNETSCRSIQRSPSRSARLVSWFMCARIINVSFRMYRFRLGFEASSVNYRLTIRV